MFKRLLTVPNFVSTLLKLLLKPFVYALWVLRQVCYGINAAPGIVAQSPVALYRKTKKWRDWVLAKVDYLEAESAKWKRTFQIVRSPYSLLLKLGFSPQWAVGLLAVGTTTATGAVAAEAMKPPSFAAGDPGVYNAPLDSPIYSDSEFNTLRLDLGSTPIGLVKIEDVTLGTAYANSALPSGESNAVIVGGIAASSDPAFTETFLEVGHMTVEKWRCDSLKLTNIEAHELIVKGNASDGQSIAAVAGVPRDRAISGGNRADDMLTSGGYYDQLKITSASSGINGKIDRLVLSNLYTKGGPCILDRIKAGTLEILVNEVGAGNGFATKEFEITTSVIYKSFVNEDNVEVNISPPS
tara:strand:+ start:1721 stop:2782 length:1062 start_codon:yes stop_codon:yes gene_type:complete